MKTTNGAEIKVEKIFPVSKEQLYKAWTSPDALKKWWHPLNNELDNVEQDLKINGKLVYHFKNANPDFAIKIDGEYLEVKENEKLVYTWNWHLSNKAIHEGKFKLSIEFIKDEVGCKLIVLQENLLEEEFIFPHELGWNKTMEDLFDYLVSESEYPGTHGAKVSYG
jgi:uncharacterized protein YndB with AHSA1/START domain